MKPLKIIFFILTFLVIGAFKLFWSVIALLIGFIDGDDNASHPTDNFVWHNLRTGEFDSVKRPDGLYNSRH